jgi:ferritin-like metal-binding protein YciE
VAELNARDTKLVQYLNEALTKEKQLEQALEAHIAMTTLAPYRKRLQQHLSETKRHAREVERRVKKLGGTSEGITGVVQDAAGVVQDVAARGVALAQGPVHMVRGTSEQEMLLKNARTEFKEEAEEIAHYTAIQKLAETVGDKDTAQLARAILREEKRMAGFLEKLIPRLTTSVVQAEIPRSERNGGRRRTTSRRKTASTSRSRSTGARSTAKRGGARSGAARSASARKKSSGSTSSRSRSTAPRSRSTARSGSGSRSGSAGRTTSGRTTARKTTRSSSGRRTTARSR